MSARVQMSLRLDAAPAFDFFLGTHRPHWLYPGARKMCPAGPLFISFRELRKRKSRYPRSDTTFSIDSGGYTELSMHGHWTIGAQEYADRVQEIAAETGTLRWAGPQDWMCEPWVIDGGAPPGGGTPCPGTKLSVIEHQRRTVDSVLELRSLAPSAPWIPVLQGWSIDEYATHVDMYSAAGLDLRREPIVGVGSICRRQSTDEVASILKMLHGRGLRLHGFGAKIKGLRKSSRWMVSSDSLAWSYAARKQGRSPDANCQVWAEKWRSHVLAGLRGEG